jgi:hypothetical protein
LDAHIPVVVVENQEMVTDSSDSEEVDDAAARGDDTDDNAGDFYATNYGTGYPHGGLGGLSTGGWGDSHITVGAGGSPVPQPFTPPPTKPIGPRDYETSPEVRDTTPL